MRRSSAIVAAYADGLLKCSNCAIYFLPNRSDQRYCCASCRTAAGAKRREPSQRGDFMAEAS